MSSMYFTDPIAVFDWVPKEIIGSSVAVAVDAQGRAHELRGGESFRGLSAESRVPLRDENKLGIIVRIEGLETLRVEGFTGVEFGKPVFATAAARFTLSPQKQPASRIGFIVGKSDNGKALVKFQSAPDYL